MGDMKRGYERGAVARLMIEKTKGRTKKREERKREEKEEGRKK
jgi:hypothetical protein